MEKIENIKIEGLSIINKLTPDNILRCHNCNLICSLKLNYQNGYPKIQYECKNKHKGNILLKDYLKEYNKFTLSNEKCNECNKNQIEIKGNMFYCIKCNKFLCYLCEIKHGVTKYNIIFIQKYDLIYKLHSNLFSFYCVQCKKNLCISCFSQHKSHNIINLSEFNYSDESKTKLKEKMKDIENKINI